jgi:hypothetical protein
MEQKRKWSILALQPFFPVLTGRRQCKIARGTTTKVGRGETNEKNKWKFTKSTAKLAKEKKNPQKNKNKNAKRTEQSADL